VIPRRIRSATTGRGVVSKALRCQQTRMQLLPARTRPGPAVQRYVAHLPASSTRPISVSFTLMTAEHVPAVPRRPVKSKATADGWARKKVKADASEWARK
jgi:hypothetical protein